ncbi:hypothetical protein P171DRAFT_6122 [Karstenula rhodostoma CBS 690.94]|uniref:Uncharacterized protein n=1 Tax=Karstenula rhodostoma CBS 690.94 TaxID=1392251 RepID=A0A9P4UI85_9PLEO|nr:hypothetical protein P171DRAFT_6122 [Karstenula rhodostoma CBS 690.94]
MSRQTVRRRHCTHPGTLNHQTPSTCSITHNLDMRLCGPPERSRFASSGDGASRGAAGALDIVSSKLGALRCPYRNARLCPPLASVQAFSAADRGHSRRRCPRTLRWVGTFTFCCRCTRTSQCLPACPSHFICSDPYPLHLLDVSLGRQHVLAMRCGLPLPSAITMCAGCQAPPVPVDMWKHSGTARNRSPPTWDTDTRLLLHQSVGPFLFFLRLGFILLNYV